ncbi:MAG: 4,5-DOPA-extradiol-dioxygenase [Planctomycetota bacterium]|jgi:4,5-DOPA dioxygenase extradiol
MPVLFAAHGSPMNVIEDDQWSRGFTGLRALVPQPRAILAVSAHWFIDGTYLTGDAAPRTIHDFSNFPAPLYDIEYAAPGGPGLAGRVQRMPGEERASLDTSWGLDHGTWSVLRWMFPEAEVPVVQLSIDRRLDVAGHVELGRSLAELREDGVLILGSGNIVHNLPDAFRRTRERDAETPDWASRFDRTVQRALEERDAKTLHGLLPGTEDGRMSHPTPEHWLPLLYAYAATDEADAVSFPVEGFDWGSLSMRCVLFR